MFYFVVLVCVAQARTSMRSAIKIYILIGLVFANIVLYDAIFGYFNRKQFSLYFLNVGQGDSELIQTRRAAVLVDAGPNQKAATNLDAIMPAYRRTIDVAMITHPNADHMAGLLDILKRYRVRVLMVNGVADTSATYDAVMKAVHADNVPIVYARAGERVSFENVSLDVLWPRLDLPIPAQLPSNKANDTAIVSLVSYRSFKALLTSDVSQSVEQKLLSVLSDIDILKVAHHGSKLSTSDALLEKIRPSYAIISVGRNTYGHPTQDVLARLREIGSSILRTDMNGTIQATIEKGKLVVRSALP